MGSKHLVDLPLKPPANVAEVPGILGYDLRHGASKISVVRTLELAARRLIGR